MRRIVLALGVCVIVVALGFAAQAPTGTLSGTVRNAAGAQLPAARLALVRDGVESRVLQSDGTGAFTFARVPAARYQLTASLAGFSPFSTHLDVAAGKTTALAIVLAPAAQAEDAAAPQAEPLHASSADASARRIPRWEGLSGSAIGGAIGGVAGGVVGGMPSAPLPYSGRPHGRYDGTSENYARIDDNPFRRVAAEPLSTFSIDVDTASYANVRRFLNAGALPPPDAVRTEELINYFRFDYPLPGADAPISITTELAACPWNPKHRLALVGLQSRPPAIGALPPRNLVFLIDVSGSMDSPDKLPLIRTGLRMLVDTLTPADRIALVVYAGHTGVVLPATSGRQKATIHAAIARLEAGGSTNGGAGITLAYDIAQQNFVKGGINRVILATDGDFNVGVTSQGALTRLIEEKRGTGVFLSVLGVGTGNIKDATMEMLADRGNGNYSYLDTLHEARKVLVSEAGATLVTVAKDVKIQVEFNPTHVGAYRLIGYENRLLANADFNNDRKDAGEIGAGHTVTALYELIPPGEEGLVSDVDPLKYQRPVTPTGTRTDEVMTVKLRYKAPDGDVSRLLSVAVKNRVSDDSPNIGFAAAVAEFGMLLRSSEHHGSATHASAAVLARRFRGPDPDGHRAEFIKLVELAGSLKGMTGE